ncbi:unnamed protein product [Closterium sp. NIES-64]|nr:unnamed protein product [Closterium sp. NIES-64]
MVRPPRAFFSAKIKARKARTRLVEVNYQGARHEGAKESLKAASEFTRDCLRLARMRIWTGRWTGASHRMTFETSQKSHLDWSVDRSFSPDDAEALSAPWQEAEVKRAPAEMAPGKTPGRDGLPKELWESLWDLLGGQMMQFLKEFERTGSLSSEFSTVVTMLLHKKGAKDDLQNYRPITLLSTVYKLIAKVLANRVKGKLERVVSAGQFGFLPGRSIAGAVSAAADVIDAANAGQEDWLMLLVDFRKAFDSVARGYMFDVLRKMGFPEAYVTWVEGLHKLTYLGYADDTTLLLRDRSQLGEAEILLKDFELRSGLVVNWDKSVVLPLGRQRDEPPPATGPSSGR